jgi:hypothetical protein
MVAIVDVGCRFLERYHLFAQTTVPGSRLLAQLKIGFHHASLACAITIEILCHILSPTLGQAFGADAHLGRSDSAFPMLDAFQDRRKEFIWYATLANGDCCSSTRPRERLRRQHNPMMLSFQY